jgi:iron complex transport system ATP-binding protein
MLEAQSLTLAYDATPVVADVSLTIPTGRITALVGRNGCGKSTLLRGLARLLAPRGGAVLLDGTSIARLPRRTTTWRSPRPWRGRR